MKAASHCFCSSSTHAENHFIWPSGRQLFISYVRYRASTSSSELNHLGSLAIPHHLLHHATPNEQPSAADADYYWCSSPPSRFHRRHVLPGIEIQGAVYQFHRWKQGRLRPFVQSAQRCLVPFEGPQLFACGADWCLEHCG